jgi:hypothetical protein
LKARKLFFEHLKDRRERLRNAAFAILPEETLRQYGVAANSFPDKTAILLWSELQEAKDQQGRRVWLPDSLNPCSDGFSIRPESLFEFPHHLQVVELALDYGLAPKDENGVPTLWSGSHIIPGSLYGRLANEVSMKYLDWLLRHDLNPELSLEPFRFSILHRIAVFIGDRIFSCLRRVKAFNLSKLSDGSSEQSYMANCAVHILTMMSLGVRHLPICLSERYNNPYDSQCEEEEWKEILDEDRELIDQLQALDEEFGDAFDRQNVPIGEFLRGYWLTRMKEVIADLNKPLDDDDRYDLWEAGVVLEEDDADGSGCCIGYTEDEL